MRPLVDESGIRLCVPMTEALARHRAAVLPLAGALTYKEPADQRLDGRPRFLESSLNLLAPDFARDFAALKPHLGADYASFACDLGPNCARWSTGQSANGYPRYLPAGPAADLGELTRRAAANAALVRDCFGGALKVENLNYFPTGAYEVVCEPEAVGRLVEAADAELLLDIGHAIISAHNLHIGVEEYCDRLPLDRVSEVHLSRPGVVAGIWEDCHQLPAEGEFALLEYVAARAPLRFATMEYYREGGYAAGQRLLYDWCRGWAPQAAAV